MYKKFSVQGFTVGKKLVHAYIVDKMNKIIGFWVTDLCFAKRKPVNDHWGMYYTHKRVSLDEGISMAKDGDFRNMEFVDGAVKVLSPITKVAGLELPRIQESLLEVTENEACFTVVIPICFNHSGTIITPRSVELTQELVHNMGSNVISINVARQLLKEARDSEHGGASEGTLTSQLVKIKEAQTSDDISVTLMFVSGDMVRFTDCIGLRMPDFATGLDDMKAVELQRLQNLFAQDTLILSNMSFKWFDIMQQTNAVSIAYDPTSMIHMAAVLNETEAISAKQKEVLNKYCNLMIAGCKVWTDQNMTRVTKDLNTIESDNLGPNCKAYKTKFNMSDSQFLADAKRLMITFHVNSMDELESEISALL